MKLIDVEQRSEEWYELRRTKIGASSSPALLGLCPYKNAEDVYNEMVNGMKTYTSRAMQHGTDTEPEALAYFNKLNESTNLFNPAVVVSEEYPFMMASLDGLCIYGDAILEIKCPGEKVFEQCANGKIPVQWEYQIQHQLCVTGLDSAFLFIYRDQTINLTVRYYRDEEMIKEIVDACKHFYENHLLAFKCPESEENKYEKKTDQAWHETVVTYLEFKKRRIEAKEQEELLREKLIQLCDGKPCKGSGIKMSYSDKKGKVDYSLIPELEGVDLSSYRAPNSIEWRICEIRH